MTSSPPRAAPPPAAASSSVPADGSRRRPGWAVLGILIAALVIIAAGSAFAVLQLVDDDASGGGSPSQVAPSVADTGGGQTSGDGAQLARYRALEQRDGTGAQGLPDDEATRLAADICPHDLDEMKGYVGGLQVLHGAGPNLREVVVDRAHLLAAFCPDGRATYAEAVAATAPDIELPS